MDIDSGPSLTMDHEGYVEGVYLDSLGFPTCGYGYCLDPTRTYRKVKEFHERKFMENYQQAEAQYETYDFGLDDTRRAAVVDMLYNLGPNKFAKFRGFISALRMKDWLSAVSSLEQSLWFKQVGRRSMRIVGMIKTGQWPT